MSTLIHLSATKTPYKIYAPDAEQMHVVDHTSGEEQGESRNALKESARIARGDVAPLSTLDPSAYSALIIPGGFGAAKNLSSFATDGPDMSVIPDLVAAISGFRDQGKPLGACCIAPTILAKTVPSASLTVGQSSGSEDVWPYQGAAGAINAMGGKHVDTEIDGFHVDEANKIVTSAAYMKNATPSEVHNSVGLLVSKIVSLM